MTNLYHFFSKPFQAKGFAWGVVDLLIKLLTLAVWLYVTGTLLGLVWQSIQLDYNPVTRMWWFSYAFLMFFGESLLAYILLFVRDYNDNAE